MHVEINKVITKLSPKMGALEIVKNIKSGKEAQVYLVSNKDNYFALKIYFPHRTMATQQEYMAGRHIREKSLRRAVAKKNKVGKELVRKLWTRREFYMLDKLYSQGANVPQVFEFTDEAILMEYLGDDNFPAPRLADVELTKAQKLLAYESVLNSIKIFLDNGIVHGDLSEYNILWWKEQPVIIDFPQALDIKKNPNWQEKLQRDLANISKYFEVEVGNQLELLLKDIDNLL